MRKEVFVIVFFLILGTLFYSPEPSLAQGEENRFVVDEKIWDSRLGPCEDVGGFEEVGRIKGFESVGGNVELEYLHCVAYEEEFRNGGSYVVNSYLTSEKTCKNSEIAGGFIGKNGKATLCVSIEVRGEGEDEGLVRDVKIDESCGVGFESGEIFEVFDGGVRHCRKGGGLVEKDERNGGGDGDGEGDVRVFGRIRSEERQARIQRTPCSDFNIEDGTLDNCEVDTSYCMLEWTNAGCGQRVAYNCIPKPVSEVSGSFELVKFYVYNGEWPITVEVDLNRDREILNTQLWWPEGASEKQDFSFRFDRENGNCKFYRRSFHGLNDVFYRIVDSEKDIENNICLGEDNLSPLIDLSLIETGRNNLANEDGFSIIEYSSNVGMPEGAEFCVGWESLIPNCDLSESSCVCPISGDCIMRFPPGNEFLGLGVWTSDGVMYAEAANNGFAINSNMDRIADDWIAECLSGIVEESDCGNGVVEGDETCDGDDFEIFDDGVNKCIVRDPRFESGDLSCNDDCTIDTSECVGEDEVCEEEELDENSPCLTCDGLESQGLVEAHQLHHDALEMWNSQSTDVELREVKEMLERASSKYVTSYDISGFENGDEEDVIANLDLARVDYSLAKIAVSRGSSDSFIREKLNDARVRFDRVIENSRDDYITSQAMTSKSQIILDLNVMFRERGENLDEVLLYLNDAVDKDPSNVEAEALLHRTRIGYLERVEKRVNENLDKISDSGLTSNSPGIWDSIAEGFGNTLNSYRAVYDEYLGHLREDRTSDVRELLMARAGARLLINLERKGGDIDEFYSRESDGLGSQVDYLEQFYLKGRDEYENSRDYSDDRLFLAELAKGMSQSFVNSDINLVARNGGNSLESASTSEFVFTGSGGYFGSGRDYEAEWYDDIAGEVNAYSVALILFPGATCARLGGRTIAEVASARVGLAIGNNGRAVLFGTAVVGSVAAPFVGGPPWLASFSDVLGDIISPFGRGVKIVGGEVAEKLVREFSEEFPKQIERKLIAKGVSNALEKSNRLADDLAAGNVKTKTEIVKALDNVLDIDDVSDAGTKAWHNAQIEKYPNWWGAQPGDILAGEFELGGHASVRMRPNRQYWPDPYSSKPDKIINGIPHSQGRGIPAPLVEDALLNPSFPPALINDDLIFTSRATLFRNGKEIVIDVITNPNTKKIKTVETRSHGRRF